jgi:hypothetical protein
MVGSNLTPGGLLRPNAEGGLLRVKHARIVKPQDILKVNNALTEYGYCVTERPSCSLVI